MARAWVEDTWYARDAGGAKIRTPRHGRGLQWRVRWYDDRRTMRSRSFRTKRDAEAWQASVEHDLRDGSYRDPKLGQVTVGFVAEEWLPTRTDLRPSSRQSYRATLDRYVLPRWGTTPVAHVRRQELAVWLSSLGEQLAPRSVIAVHRVTSMVLGWAVDTDRITTNPAARLPLPRPDGDKHVFLTHAELDALAEAAGDYRPMILTLGYTGLRFGEAAGLQVGDVDLTTRRVSVSRAWAGINTGPPYLATPKNHERRKVGLPQFLIHELEQLVAGRPATEWLFTAPRGGVLNLPNWSRRVFAPAVHAAGLDRRGMSPHSLRHTAASLAIAAGADVKVVQNMLGHKDASMTLNTYAGMFPDRLDTVANALDTARRTALDGRPAVH
jgi:integrase